MMFLVVISVGALLYEVKNPPNAITLFVEISTLIVFIFEYFARFWVYSDSHMVVLKYYEKSIAQDKKATFSQMVLEILKDKLEYMASSIAIIDLLSILPNFRAARFLRLFRLFQLFRYVKSMNILTDVFMEKKFELGMLGLFVSFIVFTSSSTLYIFEANVNPKIVTFFYVIYWSFVTISTVGYGDITPVTFEGQLVTLFLIIVGVSILAFLTSIIVSSFSEKINDMKENRVFNKIKKLNDYVLICGYGRVGEVVYSAI